jgi:hypothetical protein
MKKAKIMLMSIAVLATVGTALAFKVAKGPDTLCYVETTTPPDPTAKACPNTRIESKGVSGTTQYYYTTLTASSCANQTNCINEAASFAQ